MLDIGSGGGALSGGVECLIAARMSGYPREMWTAMVHTAPDNSCAHTRYQGSRDVLLTYGAGEVTRRDAVAKHVARGGRAICFDFGYWGSRKRNFRFSLDGTQPKPKHLAATPATGRDHPELCDTWLDENGAAVPYYDPHGFILLIGMGAKSRVQFGYMGPQWEAAALARIRAEYPGREIRYRPKGRHVEIVEAELPVSSEAKIEDALKGCALVVCRHSNVAIDACIAGVPVLCEDGAAYFLYRNGPNPTPEQRRDLLARVAWWQWSATEVNQCWKFLEGFLNER
jgi:hypothetical protein